MPSSSSRARWRGCAAPRCWSGLGSITSHGSPAFFRRPIRWWSMLRRHIRLLQTETPRLRIEGKAHVHAYGNTHYWLDPHNARPITASILTALATLRPAEKCNFRGNARCVPCAPRCQNLGMGNRAEALSRHQGRRRARQLGLLRRAVWIANRRRGGAPSGHSAVARRARGPLQAHAGSPACASLLPIHTQIQLWCGRLRRRAEQPR